MDWQELSEVSFGLLFNGRLSLDSVRPNLFMPPYDRGVELLQEGKIKPEEIFAHIGITALQAANSAASNVNGTRADWVGLLHRTALGNELATRMKRHIRDIERGEWDKIDVASVIEDYRLLDAGRDEVLVPMSEIEPSEVSFIPSGWQALDYHIGGLPLTGLIVTGGAPGAGKTTYMAKRVAKYIQTHRDKKAVVFTLEMTSGEYVKRALQVEKLKKSEMDRILICEEMMPVEEVSNTAAQVTDVGFVTVDFADLMIQDENSESEMAKIYRVLAKLAKRLRIPVELLSQLSRNYQGGVPRPNHLRYTSLAEALAWEINMVYNPFTDFHAHNAMDDKALPPTDHTAYVVLWKCRGGFIRHWSPGAICLPWGGATGWGDGHGVDEEWFNVKG